ncbi:MAG: DNA circularization N-terminal domain-containing protein [Alphaproteobacteria bacterium]|nr:DNA circularization N-terminal domain-containing protein [Alphaproteobacteria bacterium]
MAKLPEHMTLRLASLAGIKIEVPTRSMSGGRQLHVHEFVQSEEPYIEDLGGKANKFSLDAVLIGADYKTRLDQLLAACAKPGPLEFIDPWGLTIRVHVESWEQTISQKELGKAVLRLSLVKDGTGAQPSVVTDTSYVTRQASGTAATSVIEWFADSFSVENNPAALSADPVAAIGNLVSKLSTMARYGTAPAQSISAALSQAASLQAGAFGLLRTPTSLGGQAQGLISQVLGLVSTGAPRYQASRYLANSYGDDLEIIPATTATHRAEIANRGALVNLVRGLALTEQAKASADVSWMVREDAEAARAELSMGLENLASIAPDTTYVTLTDLRTAVVTDITARALDLSRLSTFTPQAHMPALLVAHKLYGDASREGEIVGRNRPMMPGYLSAGQPLTVMADAGGGR